MPSRLPFSAADLRSFFSRRPLLLAPMEDVTDSAYRALCRELGAELCVTEFINVEGLLGRTRLARRRLMLDPDDRPTAIQLYGANAERIAAAAAIVAEAKPAFIDINCGCSVRHIRERGAGAGWLRHPQALVDMARRVVVSVPVPVTIKTRLGIGDEAEMPIVDLARRLEDCGVGAITIHCRTARMGYSGTADWSYAARVRAHVAIPVVINGDIRSAAAARRALDETGCDAVMIGRRAIEHPWIFREARSLIDHGVTLPPPTDEERLKQYRRILLANVVARGRRHGVHVTRRHLKGYLSELSTGPALCAAILACNDLDTCLRLLEPAAAGRQ